ncbi:MAG: Hpt domain-containing protein, partial [Geobacteraceae bacterium]|nr:Hpt domain-containing protein [Geobacteraceae bacterium]
LFCEVFVPQLEGLALAVAAEDADGIMRHAHTIKGSAGNIAAMRMHHTSAIMEIAAKEGDLAEAPLQLARLQMEYREFTEAVATYVS